MHKVKLSIAKDNAGCSRQTPNGKAIWGNYQFFINQEIKDADFWVIYSKGERKTETCSVPPQNTLFITGEPETVYHYSKGFINQFSKVVACQKGINHPNLSHNQPAQPWHINKIWHENGEVTFSKNYDSYKNEKLPQKEKLISVITSNKAFTKGHQKRIDFVLKLKEYFGDKLDLYGRGFNTFEDKWDVIAPYKYHIAIENSSYSDYWTEKLADCFIGGAYPIYYGCNNLDKYFNKQAFSLIDPNDFDKSVQTIEKIIANNTYEQKQAELQLARDLVLDKFNLFQLITEQLDLMDPNATKQELTLKHDTAFMDLKKIQVMILSRTMNKIRMKLK